MLYSSDILWAGECSYMQLICLGAQLSLASRYCHGAFLWMEKGGWFRYRPAHRINEREREREREREGTAIGVRVKLWLKELR